MSTDNLVLFALLIPLCGALLIPLFARSPNRREAVTLVAAVALFITVIALLASVLGGARPGVHILQLAAGLDLEFEVEPIGMLFATVASTLWIVNSIYSIGYMRGNSEKHQTPYYVCFAIALAATMGIAFAANLFTLFIFYEALTLSTYPLVVHKRDKDAINGGRIYLIMLLGSSLLLLLPAILITYSIAGTMAFTPGGILAGKANGLTLGLLLALYAFGIGKAGIMPGHFWLPAAMVAPTPVSALLHAVAVVKAGVFCVVKVVVYVFGLETLAVSGQSEWLIYVASFTILAASVVALMQDNLKKRLAYSTVSQLSYIVLAAALATTASVAGGALHIAMHAAGKITLFFCAGAIYVATHKTEIKDLDGIGRRMPFTMTAFLIGSLSIIGLPPFGGVWSKWAIAVGAMDAGHAFVIGVLMLSSLLNVAYLLPIVGRAFFVPATEKAGQGGIAEAPLACVVPLCFTAFLCLLLFFLAGDVDALIKMALTQP